MSQASVIMGLRDKSGVAVGFYSSWGTQAQFTAKELSEPHQVVRHQYSTGSFSAHCTCGWRSVATTASTLADSHGAVHMDQAVRAAARTEPTARAEKVPTPLTVRRINRVCRGSFGQAPPRKATWVRNLVGRPETVLAQLVENDALLLAAALSGEDCPDDRLLPDDPGDLSGLSLLVGWAPTATDEELNASLHWGSAEYRGAMLPLRPGYCPSLYEFIDSRGGAVKMHGTDEFALIDAKLVRHASRAAEHENEYRNRLSTPTADELARLTSRGS